MGEPLRRVEFVGVPSLWEDRDGNIVFCWDVTPDVYRAVAGREPDEFYGSDYTPGTFVVFPDCLLARFSGDETPFRYVIETHPADAGPAPPPSCGSCRFWSPDHDGECRRRAPRVATVVTGENPPMVDTVVFPPSPAGGWCGEFEAK